MCVDESAPFRVVQLLLHRHPCMNDHLLIFLFRIARNGEHLHRQVSFEWLNISGTQIPNRRGPMVERLSSGTSASSSPVSPTPSSTTYTLLYSDDARKYSFSGDENEGSHVVLGKTLR